MAGVEIFKLDLGDKVISIDSFSLNGNDLTLNFTTKENGSQSVTQSLTDLQQLEIKNNVQNYTELLTVTGQDLYDFAYVREPQGTPWLPGSIGGTYYGSGLYMWDGLEWTEDDTDIFIQLESIINSMYKESVNFITSDYTLPDSNIEFYNTIIVKNVTSSQPLTINTEINDKLENEDSQVIYPGESLNIKRYQLNDYRVI